MELQLPNINDAFVRTLRSVVTIIAWSLLVVNTVNAQRKVGYENIIPGEKPINLTKTAEQECTKVLRERVGESVIEIKYQPRLEKSSRQIFANLKDIYKEINTIVTPLSVSGIRLYLLGMPDPPKSYKIILPKTDELLLYMYVFDSKNQLDIECEGNDKDFCNNLYKTLPHETIHTLTDKLINHKETRWFDDGLSNYVGGEIMDRFKPELRYSLKTGVLQAALDQKIYRDRLFKWKDVGWFGFDSYLKKIYFEMQMYDAAHRVIQLIVEESKKNGVEKPLSILLSKMTELTVKNNEPLSNEQLIELVRNDLKVDVRTLGILDEQTRSSLVAEALNVLSKNEEPSDLQNRLYAMLILANIDEIVLSEEWNINLLRTVYDRNGDEIIKIMAATALVRRDDRAPVEKAFNELRQTDEYFKKIKFRTVWKYLKQRSIDSSL